MQLLDARERNFEFGRASARNQHTPGEHRRESCATTPRSRIKSVRFGGVLFVMISTGGLAARCETDPRLTQALPEIAKQASKFWQAAPRFVARETVKQKAIAPQRKRLRIGQAAVQPLKPVFSDREIVSYYGFSSFRSAPEALHEVRRIISVDEKHVEDPVVAQEGLERVIESKNDAHKQALLKDFEKANLSSAAVDFGQLILLFTRSRLDQYSFELNNTGMAGADQALVISFHQSGGDGSLQITEAGKRIRRPLEGELWVRQSDYAVLRITLTTLRMDGKLELRDEARVDYIPNPLSAILPASITYRRFVNDELHVENIYQYSDWVPVGTK